MNSLHERPARIPRVNLVCAFAFLILGAASSVYALWPRDVQSGCAYAEKVPRAIGSWVSRSYTMRPRVLELLGTDDVLSRTYLAPDGSEVDFVVIFARHTRRATHPPEICLRGEGWLIEKLTSRTLRLDIPGPRFDAPFRVKEIVIGGTRGKKLVHYFYKSGKRYTHNYVREQINVALGRLHDPSTSDALIRLTISIDERGIEFARERLRNLLETILPEVDRHLP